MKWTKNEIDRVRNISIAQTMGIMHGRKTKIVCPMPNHKDKTASFLIDEKNCYYCFGCGINGCGFIDFVTEILSQDGIPKDEIFPMIMEEYGVKEIT
jgi:DNA primase